MTPYTFEFRELDGAIALSLKLGRPGAAIFVGDTTPDTRRERFRATLEAARSLDAFLQNDAFAYRVQERIEEFQKIYGEPIATTVVADEPKRETQACLF